MRDLAVVTICCGQFHTLPFGDASRLEPGGEVVAIGYALGLSGEASITRGIVSAIRYDSRYLSDVIQTDAAINPGNSGGPMLSMSGEILGINTFKISEARVEDWASPYRKRRCRGRLPCSGPALQVPRLSQPANQRLRREEAMGFGPTSGELRHNPTDNLITTQYADVSIANMVVEVTFVNPYSAASTPWDYGFILRDGSSPGHIQVFVDSRGRWNLIAGDGTSSDHRAAGTLRRFNTVPRGRNHLQVVAIRERGWLFVNGEFVTTLDLSSVPRAGDVAVITGAYEGSEAAGAVTRYENFRASRLTKQYGPADGRLQREGSDLVAEHGSGVWTRDLVAEAEFINPRDSEWDYGFIVRGPVLNRLEVIGVAGNAWWFHDTRSTGDDEYTEVADGWLYEVGASFLSRNRLLLLAFGESGWLFVNDRLLAKLDLSHNLDYGSVSVMGDFFGNHNGSPEFEDFNVWAP